ncbi:MAG: hypothetical protein ACR2P6_09220, partial [Gammaproteobacteria bacterium]
MMPAAGRVIGNPLLVVLISVSLVVYPLAIYWLLDTLGTQALGFVLLALLLVRFWSDIRAVSWAGPALLAVAAAYAAMLILIDSKLVLTLYPSALNLLFAALFVASILNPPTVIERMAISAGRTLSERSG